MIAGAAAASLNHVLAQNGWARKRLSPFAGQCIEFRAPPLVNVRLAIQESGTVQAAAAASEPGLRVSFKAAALPLLLARNEAALKDVEFAGPAELAECVRFLLLNLKWDVEEDLSKIFGDALAHRMTVAANDFTNWQRDAAQRVAQNVSEYLTRERSSLVSADALKALAEAIGRLREDCDQLEKRIERLERSTPAPRSKKS